MRVEREALVEEALGAFARHNEILLYLLAQVPEEGFAAVPQGSRGRDVARQFFHMNRVREGWIEFQRSGVRPKLARADRGPRPTRARLDKALRASGKGVLDVARKALDGEAKIRMFGKSPLRFLGYLIAHESHHRGQILLALKQNGLRLPEKVAVSGLWGKWIYGR